MLLPSHVFPLERFYLPPSCPGDDPVSECAAATLAQRGIDVWGMDFRMLSVPEDTEDFAFMEQWDYVGHDGRYEDRPAIRPSRARRHRAPAEPRTTPARLRQKRPARSLLSPISKPSSR